MDDKVERLEKFMHSYFEKYGEINQKDVLNLNKINDAIETIIDKRKDAMTTLKENKVVISNIVKLVKLSNKTIYNNKVLLDFCNYCISQFKINTSNHISKYKNPDEIIKILSFERDLLIDKEMEIIKLKERIDELEEMLGSSSRKKKKIKDSLTIDGEIIKGTKEQ